MSKVFGIALVFVMVASTLPLSGLVQSQALAQEPRTWYVDDDLQEYPAADFTKIQEAVDAARESGSTYVNGTISSNTTWSAADSPYIVIGNILVENGVTLTIEPEVVVKFNSDKMLQVEGELIAMGTEAKPIVFTSNHPSPSPGDWACIEFTDTSVDATHDAEGNYLSGSIMRYCTVGHSGSGNAALKIESASPFIDNCVIENNRALGIYVSQGSPKITNSTITNNSISTSSNVYGGGIYASGEGIIISKNTIASNSISAVTGSFSHYSAYGGGIYASGAVTISENIITGNSALKMGYSTGDAYGGGIYASGTITICNNTITDNEASGYHVDTYGGGIYASGTITICNNLIATNSASRGDRYGGGIYASGEVIIRGNTITNNSVCGSKGGWGYAYGGGIYTSGDGIIVTDNSISYNLALNDYGCGCGGGIYATGNDIAIIENSIINNKVSTEDAYHAQRFFARGGGVYASGMITICDNIIADNLALETDYDSGDVYGGGIYASSSVSIRGNKIASNFALDEGGGIYGGGTISHNRISNNSAADGGGIYGSAAIANNTIIGNSANKGKGGGIHISGQPSINYNNIHSNTPYDVYNSNSKGSPDVDASNNWWGTTEEAEIQAHIYDWFDDSNLGLVNYIPYLVSPISKTWYVDDDKQDYPAADFTKIQEAVDNATAGDTIIVYPGTYTENVDVNKDHLTIRSQNGADSTIVQAANSDDHVFEVTTDYVDISGFTTKGATSWNGTGIYLGNANHCNISGTTITNNCCGIYLYDSGNNMLTNNTASYNDVGIYLYDSSSNTLVNNTCSNNSEGNIWLFSSSNNNTLINNTASYNDVGIYLYDSSSNMLTNNTMVDDGICISGHSLEHWNTHTIDTSNEVNGRPVYYWKNSTGGVVPAGAGQVILANCTHVTVENQNISSMVAAVLLGFCSNNTLINNTASYNDIGICLYDSSSNTLTNNTCSNNTHFGIYLYDSSSNKMYLNNFMDNNENVRSEDSTNTWNSPEELTYTYNGSTYTSYLGNYWDDYVERYPNANETDSTGIWDTPYSIDSDADDYPLVEPFENYQIGPLPIERNVRVLIREYDPAHGVPIGMATATYEHIGHDAEGNIYQVTSLEVELVGFSGRCRAYILDADKNEIWSEELLRPPSKPYTQTYTPNIKVYGTYWFGIELEGLDVVTFLMRSVIGMYEWYIKGADKLLGMEIVTIEQIEKLVRPDDVDWGIKAFKDSPCLFHQSAEDRFAPDASEPAERIQMLWPSTVSMLASPGELRVYDSEGRVTGLVDGEPKEEIPHSMYFENIVFITKLDSDLAYTVEGTEDGDYLLMIAYAEDDFSEDIIASEVPLTVNATHEYTIDWTALEQGEAGVTISKDADGDGQFEETITTAPPYMPSAPSPSSGATGVSVGTSLGWTGGDPDGDNVTYRVYFGTDEDPPLVSENQTETSYSPSLDYDTKYYWRVVVRDEHGMAADGPVWQFATPGATLEGHVSFTGRNIPPNDRWIESFAVKLFEPGNLSNVLWIGNATTNETGVFTVEGLEPGTYDIGIKNWTCLGKMNMSVSLNASETKVVDFGMPVEADTDNNDMVDGWDYSLVLNNYGTMKIADPAGWAANEFWKGDFNRDEMLDGWDYSAVLNNYGDFGEIFLYTH